MKVRDSFEIKNGKLFDPFTSYHEDFHYFFKKELLICYILIPGINKKSILIHIDKLNIHIKFKVISEFAIIYKTFNLTLNGKLPQEVIPTLFTTEYNAGILKIKMRLI